MAAEPGFWIDNAVHLPQMIATSWLGLRQWQEGGNLAAESPEIRLPWTFLRPAVLLWLACLQDDEWVALDDLAQHLRAMNPEWDRPSLPLGNGRPGRSGTPRRPARAGQRRKPHVPCVASGCFACCSWDLAMRWGWSAPARRRRPAARSCNSRALGRYVLAMGPPPPPRPTFEHFLFVQPNLEIIAYRQGLSPQLVGRLSRFAWWTKIGAALELKLTQESIVLGLEGGETPEQMLEILTHHSQRPLPTLVPDAIVRWANRREQITFYAAATLIEFPSPAERDLALAAWQEDYPNTFIPVADLFLLVENPQQIPTDGSAPRARATTAIRPRNASPSSPTA